MVFAWDGITGGDGGLGAGTLIGDEFRDRNTAATKKRSFVKRYGLTYSLIGAQQCVLGGICMLLFRVVERVGIERDIESDHIQSGS